MSLLYVYYVVFILFIYVWVFVTFKALQSLFLWSLLNTIYIVVAPSVKRLFCFQLFHSYWSFLQHLVKSLLNIESTLKTFLDIRSWTQDDLHFRFIHSVLEDLPLCCFISLFALFLQFYTFPMVSIIRCYLSSHLLFCKLIPHLSRKIDWWYFNYFNHSFEYSLACTTLIRLSILLQRFSQCWFRNF